MALREHGLASVKEAKLGVLEMDRAISSVPSGPRIPGRLRILRQRQ